MKKEQIKTLGIIFAVIFIIVIIFFIANTFGLTGQATTGSDPKGNPCSTSADCDAFRPYCNPETDTCEKCTLDSQCAENPNVGAAKCINKKCLVCNFDSDCKTGWNCLKINETEKGLCINYEAVCNNSIDEDDDGKIDYADDDCESDCSDGFIIYPIIDGVKDNSIAGCCDSEVKCFSSETGCADDFIILNYSGDILFCSIKNNTGVWCPENYKNDGNGNCVLDLNWNYNLIYNLLYDYYLLASIPYIDSYSQNLVNQTITGEVIKNENNFENINFKTGETITGKAIQSTDLVCCVTTPNNGGINPCVGGSIMAAEDCMANDEWYKICSIYAPQYWIQGCSSCLTYGIQPSNEGVIIGPRLQALWEMCGPNYSPTSTDDNCYDFQDDFCCADSSLPVCGSPVCEISSEISVNNEDLDELIIEELVLTTDTASECNCYNKPGWTPCKTMKGIQCCNDKYEFCNDGGTFGVTRCSPSNKCEDDPNMQLCPAKNFPKCCKKEDTCGLIKVRKGFKNYEVAICTSNSCDSGDAGYCDTDDKGISSCCESPLSKCTDEPIFPLNINICIASESDCINNQDGYTEYCGSEERGARCCPPGTCFIDGVGVPHCAGDSQ